MSDRKPPPDAPPGMKVNPMMAARGSMRTGRMSTKLKDFGLDQFAGKNPAAEDSDEE